MHFMFSAQNVISVLFYSCHVSLSLSYEEKGIFPL